jgi:hypothetical protein
MKGKGRNEWGQRRGKMVLCKKASFQVPVINRNYRRSRNEQKERQRQKILFPVTTAPYCSVA